MAGGTLFTTNFLRAGFLAAPSLAARFFTRPFRGATFFLRTAFFFMAKD